MSGSSAGSSPTALDRVHFDTVEQPHSPQAFDPIPDLPLSPTLLARGVSVSGFETTDDESDSDDNSSNNNHNQRDHPGHDSSSETTETENGPSETVHQSDLFGTRQSSSISTSTESTGLHSSADADGRLLLSPLKQSHSVPLPTSIQPLATTTAAAAAATTTATTTASAGNQHNANAHGPHGPAKIRKSASLGSRPASAANLRRVAASGQMRVSAAQTQFQGTGGHALARRRGSQSHAADAAPAVGGSDSLRRRRIRAGAAANNAHAQSEQDRSHQEDDVGEFVAPAKPLSFVSYMTAELTRGYLLESDAVHYAAKRDRVYTTLQIPFQVERVIMFGSFLCLDSFLFVFTFLPVRILIALLTFLRSLFTKRPGMDASQVCDVLRGVLVLTCCVGLEFMDSSRLYHSIRGQSVIKLYVIYNMLEIVDKLCCSIGQDILDSVFWTATEPSRPRGQHVMGTLPHLLLAIIYVFGHAVIIFYQVLTLNVAVNSHSSALLTLLISNQFVELKGSVFKKFEAHSLFQMTCSDMVERFSLAVFLVMVAARNMSELGWDTSYLVNTLLKDLIAVYISECVLDWVKHAFITKFNKIDSSVYRKYKTILCKDLASSRHCNTMMDQSHRVARRIGFVALPLACVVFRTFSYSIPIPPGMYGAVVAILAYLILMALKVLVSIVLLGQACEHWRQHATDNLALLLQNAPPTKSSAANAAAGVASDVPEAQ
ncbi:hypothetical protein CAOG_08528 [Capsaspora owczarzaki ATCC 30864]|uniref:Transmembrane anterior posterior transformation 1 n=1 Tax=Capsaspora owczarzaki (strain ATCC 30864) TaxID=595528 RepID=A0A0D2WJL5_CAPO3|nr:hypothetical protein CAOG_08528 [Capsaspora owczarzaki ATCC 30864]KJE90280.1 hypothetical protein CAOG_008528 [Capsaspora owczarzaki ATCC 30864]|eukprot:XP_011270109.1 hypothetical protein CAOG_08528 [Capsaspora owczarzaki ATCC 30864]